MDERFAREEDAIRGRNEALDLGEAVAPRGLGRREFFRRGLGLAGGLALGSSFETFFARAARGQAPGGDYGPLRPTIDPATGLPLLNLPEGFRYYSFGWTGDAIRGGVRTPALHDGMAAIPVGDDRVVLIRNHEQGNGPAFRAPTYDPAAQGGTTNIQFNMRTGEVEQAWPSLSGTIRNCAGGATPWGTWLTCEENFSGGPTGGPAKTHGWIFEVPPFGWANPTPLWDMGRFSHEAIAVDPATDVVYETQDQSDASGFYRFLPNARRNLRAGGTLQMLVARSGGAIVQDLRVARPVGTTFDVSWVTIPNPTLAGIASPNANSVFNQGFAQGAARFYRLEGAWYSDSESVIYFDDTGPVAAAPGHFGQIWRYDPAEEQLRLVFSSPGRGVLDMPDNLTVSPRAGGLVICEDGSNAVQRLHGLGRDGRLFPLAENRIVIPAANNPKPLIPAGSYTDFEWAGATFVPGGPDGQYLMVNVQTPGVTFVITGPWARGAL